MIRVVKGGDVCELLGCDLIVAKMEGGHDAYLNVLPNALALLPCAESLL